MITNLRNAKMHLGRFVRLAAEGEEILITVHGKPMARLVAVTTLTEDSLPSREQWFRELTEAAEMTRPGPPHATGQDFWDEISRDKF